MSKQHKLIAGLSHLPAGAGKSPARILFAKMRPQRRADSPMLLFQLHWFSALVADFAGKRADDIVLTMAYLADFLGL